ncbi:hypothetical protein C1Y40_05559 [Mycobacterium talmoniae]|uniref:Uncharacterized protein n=1 Tax=Mycobacterium talmoniae TaxID=1858794 RepID=A0A2S8BCA9_9MYCO|nr:hypothetical protein C1Y40_05559 [Mycobacterium talmoniae]
MITPTGLPSSTTITASCSRSALAAALTNSPAPISGSGGLMCWATASARLARPSNTADNSSRSETLPATSPAITGGSAPTTGICDTPYSRRMLIASRTVSDGCVCTRSGSAPDFPRSTSPTVGCAVEPSSRVRRKPYDDIQASLKIFDM